MRDCPDAALVERAPARPGTRRCELGETHGYRNAQATVIAPTGTIGLVMDCDTTGIEPDFALVKFKKLAGGGYFKIINQAVPEALADARLRPDEIEASSPTRVGHGTLADAPALNHAHAAAQGFRRRRDRCKIEAGARRRPSTSNSCSTNGRSARLSAATC